MHCYGTWIVIDDPNVSARSYMNIGRCFWVKKPLYTVPDQLEPTTRVHNIHLMQSLQIQCHLKRLLNQENNLVQHINSNAEVPQDSNHCLFSAYVELTPLQSLRNSSIPANAAINWSNSIFSTTGSTGIWKRTDVPRPGHQVWWLWNQCASWLPTCRQGISPGRPSRTPAHGTWCTFPPRWFAWACLDRPCPVVRCTPAGLPCRHHGNLEDSTGARRRAHWTRTPDQMNPIYNNIRNRFKLKLRQTWQSIESLFTSNIVSVPNSFLHLSISAHICIAFSKSNFLAFRNLH